MCDRCRKIVERAKIDGPELIVAIELARGGEADPRFLKQVCKDWREASMEDRLYAAEHFEEVYSAKA